MSSLSMPKVRGRALNSNAQNTNNYSLWMAPLSHADYPLTYVENPTNNALVTSNGVKNVVTAQPGLLYNKVRLDVSGSVNPTTWTTGQTVQTVYFAGDDAGLHQKNQSGIVNDTVAYCSFTPKSPNSKVIVEYSALYEISGGSGAGLDEFTSYITITTPSIVIGKREQQFPSGDGTGTRGSTLFPIMGAYNNINNTALTPIQINIVVNRTGGVTSDDSIRFYNASYDAGMKITEIAN